MVLLLTHSFNISLVPFNTLNVDPCNNYSSLDDHWRVVDSSNLNDYNYCDYNVDWNGWYRLFYNGQSAKMPNSCVRESRCGSQNPLWLNGSHPQLEEGVVTRKVCSPTLNDCCGYKSLPIQVKACPGNYYVYQFVRPLYCAAYCSGDSFPPLVHISHVDFQLDIKRICHFYGTFNANDSFIQSRKKV